MNDNTQRLLREGKTCGQLTTADRAAVLIDAASYFGALRSALLGAERSIALAGWDIDSRAPIRGAAEPDDGAPVELGPLLRWLAERRRDLVVRVLLWDYSVLYALEREPMPRLNLGWKTPANVRVELDDRLPFGASHHEKIVIVDDRVAFCGGIDLTIRRWDRPEHEAADVDRVDPDGEPYDPFHDLQMVVDGETARALGELVRERWNRVARSRDEPVDAATDPWPEGVEPDFRDIAVGIVRTRPKYEDETEIREVEAAYLAAIASAESLIYIENQYLTVDVIAAALAERLEAVPGLELVVVSPKEPQGWLEEQTMGQRRALFVGRLMRPAIRDRVRVLYPWVADGSERVPVMVHAKLMIVDDVWLELGSSNLSCRSMGVDRECDLAIEARDAAACAQVLDMRRRLLAHHLGVAAATLAERETELRSTIAAIESLAGDRRGLEPVPEPGDRRSDAPDLLLELADPERPVSAEQFIGDLFGAAPSRKLRRHLIRLLGVAALLGAGLALWQLTPLREWIDADRLAALLEGIGTSAWSGPIVLGSFVLGSFVVFPVTVLIAAAAVALGPAAGFGWALGGTLAAAALNFAAGRLMPERLLEDWFGKWLGRLRTRLRRGGIVPIMVLRNVPVAPFTVVNVVAGAFRVRFVDYLAGTVLGMTPGIAVLTILGDRMRGMLASPDWRNTGLLALAIALWIGVAIGLQIASNRLARRR